MPDFLIVSGLILLVSGELILIVRAFGTAISWGLACTFVPPASIPFMVIYPRKSVKPVILMVAGISAMLLAGYVGDSQLAEGY